MGLSCFLFIRVIFLAARIPYHLFSLLMVLSLLNSHKNADIFCNTINREQNIASWLSSNRLSLNLKKTQFMIFKTKGKKL